MTTAARTSGASPLSAVLDDEAIRRAVNEFSVAKAEGPRASAIARLAARWHQLNEAHFDGELSPAYLAVLEPRSPRALGDCSRFSGHGGRLQIRIRPSHVDGTANRDKLPPPGKTVRFMREDHAIEFRHRWIDDILLHEMGHQYEMEVLGTDGGHGRDFCDLCNRIGTQLGLPPVVIRRRKGDPRSLPICSDWPSNVRPEGFYGDLWAERSAAAEEDEDAVLAWVARFAAFDEADQHRGLTHPIVKASLEALGVTANGADKPLPTGEQLKEARLARGLSQAQLAVAVGITQASVSRAERGGQVSAEQMARIAAELGL